MAAQGLTCARIIALSLSLVLGKVSKLSTCVSLKYGEDPALSEPAKQARKAGEKSSSSKGDNNKEDLAGAVGNDVKSAGQTKDITPKQDSSRHTTSLPSFKSLD